MAVLRVVANIEAQNPAEVASFYQDLFQLDVLMDQGWIVTVGKQPAQGTSQRPLQLSAASQGGSDTPVPRLSIEVDDLDTVLARAQAQGIAIEYGPAQEPWGIRRFFVRDPTGQLVNVSCHT